MHPFFGQYGSTVPVFLDVLRWVIPVLVTGHALLNKRDTAACAGWIGVAWISPFIGGTLYLMFGINRVHRRAQRLMNRRGWQGRESSTRFRQGVEGNLVPLARMLSRLTERPLLGGNTMRVLHNGDEAYPAMLAAVAAAQRSVLLCSYIFRADRAGEDFAAALAAARKRGVEVRVLVDGIGSGYFSCPIGRRLARDGVPCARFMHSIWPWRMPFINLRDHRKILVVDGTVGFMGGLNIGDENLLRQETALKTKLPVADTHFRLEGPVVRQLAEVFLADWFFTTGEELDESRHLPEPLARGETPMRIVTAGPDADLEKIEFGMLQAVSLARTQVRLMTPYFLPDDRFTSVLGLAAMRGVTVDIVVPRRSNHAILDHARDANLRPYLESGCRVWFADPPFNHSKLMVIDDEWSFVGSANLDVRSLRLNFEINLEVYDRNLAAELSAFMQTHQKHRVTHHDLDRRPLPVRLRDAAMRLFLPYL